jgi:beta-lactam-binding protein with PASTA domain
MRNKSLVILVLALSVALAGCRKRVPDLQGKTEAEAVAALKDADLEVGEVLPAKGAPGVVGDQEPKAGERLPEDKKVTIVLRPAAAGDKDGKKGDTTPPPAGMVAVPNLADQTVEAAKKILEGAQLTLGDQTVSQNAGTAGTIFDQNPFAGSNVEPGTSVNVKIRATVLVEVPDVVGKTQPEAEALLKGAQLAVGEIELRINDSSSIPLERVLESNPSPKTRILEQTPVKLVIRQQSVMVPNVVSKPQEGAEQILKSVGLTPAVGCVTSPIKMGLVVSQLPLENQLVPKGSRVFIRVGARGRCIFGPFREFDSRLDRFKMIPNIAVPKTMRGGGGGQ